MNYGNGSFQERGCGEGNKAAGRPIIAMNSLDICNDGLLRDRYGYCGIYHLFNAQLMLLARS